MSLEIEFKYPVHDLAAVERKLAQIGAKLAEPIVQVDRYFSHPCRDFGTTDEALRTRHVGKQNFITYKGKKLDRTSKSRREIEIPLPAGEKAAQQMDELLKSLGFRVVAEVRKTRKTAHLDWQSREVEAALDDVDSVGSFVELEIQADESELDEAGSSLEALAKTLGLGSSERRSYLELLLAKKS